MMKKEKSDNGRLKAVLDKIIEKAIKKSVFSGCSIAISVRELSGFSRKEFHYGYTEQTRSYGRVNRYTYFDLASLTKPLVTTFSIAALVDQNILCLEDSLASCSGWKNIPADKSFITIRDLLCHSSGLPPHRNFFKKLVHILPQKRKETVRDWIINEKLQYVPGSRNEYSDLGYILLGMIIEEKTSMSLDAFWMENIIKGQDLKKGFLFSGDDGFMPSTCAFTGFFGEKTRKGWGIVHDDNCRALGGICGHAGLFGTASSVLKLCEAVLDQYKNRKNVNLSDIGDIKNFLKKEKNSNWSCGFDIPAESKSSCGKLFSRKSRGHLGFTGTSFWMDLEKEIIVVFLTNRVHCSKNNEEIKKYRPLIHDCIMRELSRK